MHSLSLCQAKNDLQTEADRQAQSCIIASLARQFPAMRIIGEEGEQNLSAVPAELLVSDTDADFARRPCPPAFANVREEDLVVWVDPLDGTAEYAKGFVEHVTVLIGVAYKDVAIGGIIHQPFFKSGAEATATPTTLGRTIWGLRGLGAGGFAPKAPPGDGSFVVTTTRSHSNALVTEALDALQPSAVLRVGGAGYKVLQLLEGHAHAYVFASAGCKKWDTCAPEAVLESVGGRLTDIAGVQYAYGALAAFPNRGGVLATAPGTAHADVVARIPERLKKELV